MELLAMPDEESGVRVPGWAWKAILGIVQSILLTAMFATIAWAWNAEKRLATLEHKTSDQQAQIEVLQTESTISQQNHTQIELLKLELQYIKSGIDDLKLLLKEK